MLTGSVAHCVPGVPTAEGSCTSPIVPIPLARALPSAGRVLSRSLLTPPAAAPRASAARVAGSGLNRIEFGSCVSLLNCTFQPRWPSSVYRRSLRLGSLDEASMSFLLILVFLRKTMTVTCLYLYSIRTFKIRELSTFSPSVSHDFKGVSKTTSLAGWRNLGTDKDCGFQGRASG